MQYVNYAFETIDEYVCRSKYIHVPQKHMIFRVNDCNAFDVTNDCNAWIFGSGIFDSLYDAILMSREIREVYASIEFYDAPSEVVNLFHLAALDPQNERLVVRTVAAFQMWKCTNKRIISNACALDDREIKILDRIGVTYGSACKIEILAGERVTKLLRTRVAD